jgi:hypothetical protein
MYLLCEISGSHGRDCKHYLYIMLYSLVDSYQRFGETSSGQRSRFLRNIGICLPQYTVYGNLHVLILCNNLEHRERIVWKVACSALQAATCNLLCMYPGTSFLLNSLWAVPAADIMNKGRGSISVLRVASLFLGLTIYATTYFFNFRTSNIQCLKFRRSKHNRFKIGGGQAYHSSSD